MNLTHYINTFGNKTFKQRPFNDVDALIMSQLSYLNFDLVAPSINDKNLPPIYIKDLPLNRIKELVSNELTSRQNGPFLLALITSVRYKNIGIQYVLNEKDYVNEKQIFAITLLLPTGEHFISYRGTDLSLVGWKEDLKMSYVSRVPAQEVAINYLDKVTSLFSGSYYIGGHSKGGNLSFYAALSQNKEQIDRTLKAYSFDGQGFYSNNLFENEHFELIKAKLVKIVPKYCVVGIMLNDIKNIKVVDATSLGIFQHNPHNWIIDSKTGDFKYIKRRSKQSYINELAVHNWVESLNKEETILIVDVIFDYLGELHLSLTSLIEKLPRTIANFFRVHRQFSDLQKKKISSIYKRLFYYYRKAHLFYNSKEGKRVLSQQIKEKKDA